MHLEHHLVGGYVRYISPHIIIIMYYYSAYFQMITEVNAVNHAIGLDCW